jgi:hypothetical protein
MRLHEIKKLLYNKEMVTRLKRQLMGREKTFASYISDKGLITRIYKELKNQNFSKINDPMKKWTNELNGAFSKKEVRMAKKHMKKYSTSLFITKMQIKIMLRFHLTLVIMAIIKNTNNKCWQGCGEKGTLMQKLLQPVWKTVWRLLKKLKNRMAI